MIPTGFDRFRSRLAILLTLLLLPIVGYMAVLGWISASEQSAQARDQVRYLALVASSYQRELFAGTERLFRALSQEPEISGGGTTCESELARTVAGFPDYPQIAVADADGVITCVAGKRDLLGTRIAGRPFFEQARQRRTFVAGAYMLDANSGVPSVIAVQPMLAQDGSFRGVLLATVQVGLVPGMLRSVDMPVDSRLFVLDENGAVLGSSASLPARFADAPERARIARTPHEQFTEKGDDGITRLFVVSKIESGNFSAVLGVPLHDLTALSQRDVVAQIVGPIAIWIIAVLIVWVATDRLIARPLRKLTRTARAYSYGDLEARPVEGGTSEIRALAQTFAEMATRIASRERDLQDAIVKRDGMLREIHHRVKNNLQIVTSLLNLQEKQIAPDSRGAFRDMQTRVRSLALVHRYMYESDELGSVNLGGFLKELATSLQLAYGVPEKQVVVEVIAEPIWDVADRAIPLALLMTEAMTNALRHGFPEGRPGRIEVRLMQLEGRRVRFCVHDDGIGLPGELAAGTLGMTLIRAFARQVGGALDITSQDGTMVTVEFDRMEDETT
ncbi:sensor histidine kinase [Roseiterribacter gracilis]|uniref:histidine kinase n=1 Tax=Roseiterribacter gracilis TaxID=2812848 RepID=A0A8S8XD05_9PROT|nr:histidine kinase [Rhodospirillales bacterium TMPK1]